jgi:hypothetical protein
VVLVHLCFSNHPTHVRSTLTSGLGWRRGIFGKGHPHFDTHANIPLVVCHPESRHHGERAAALASTVDLFSTILAVGGGSPPAHVESRSLLPIALDPGAPGRDRTIYGTFGQGICITDGTWTLIRNPRDQGPLYAYSSYVYQSMTVPVVQCPVEHGLFVPGIEFPQWKTPVREAAPACLGATATSVADVGSDLLYRRDTDPGQERNLIADEPAETRPPPRPPARDHDRRRHPAGAVREARDAAIARRRSEGGGRVRSRRQQHVRRSSHACAIRPPRRAP